MVGCSAGWLLAAAVFIAAGASAQAQVSAASAAGPASVASASATRSEQDPASWVEFVEDDTATCSQRMAKRLNVRSAHPTRTVRVWLDRVHMGTGTGDRSRTDLRPGAEPEPLGCNQGSAGPQSWKVGRAQFVE